MFLSVSLLTAAGDEPDVSDSSHSVNHCEAQGEVPHSAAWGCGSLRAMGTPALPAGGEPRTPGVSHSFLPCSVTGFHCSLDLRCFL